MVELDVGHDRALGVVEDKRAIGFIDLRDQPFRLTRPRARAVADEHRRVVAGLGEDVAGHVGHGRLAGAAADRDRVGLVDQLGQHLCAGEHLDAHRRRGVELRR